MLLCVVSSVHLSTLNRHTIFLDSRFASSLQNPLSIYDHGSGYCSGNHRSALVLFGPSPLLKIRVHRVHVSVRPRHSILPYHGAIGQPHPNWFAEDQVPRMRAEDLGNLLQQCTITDAKSPVSRNPPRKGQESPGEHLLLQAGVCDGRRSHFS